MAFLFMIMMTSGYTMSAVADEKENRTMEVLITSIPPGRLIGGRIIGIVSIGLTLLITWTLVIILGIVVARQFGVGWFNTWTGALSQRRSSLPSRPMRWLFHS